MPLGRIFWIIMLFWLIFGVLVNRNILTGPYIGWGNSILLFILFLILGWKVFGAAITG